MSQITLEEAIINEATRVGVKRFQTVPNAPGATILIVGRRAPLSNKMLRDATNFFLNKLMPRLTDKLTIIIRWTDSDIFHGECTWLDSNDRPREFEITLSRNLPWTDILQALAHELVHVKQFARNEMKDYLSNRPTTWFGKPIDADMPYYDLPWEAEAYDREVVLMHAYVKEMV